MAIEFVCPNCQQRLGVSDESAGKSAKCPRCGTVSPIPAAGTGMPPTPAPASPFSDVHSPPPTSPFATTSDAINPYASPAFEPKPQFVAHDGPIVNQVVGVEPILNHAWQVWKNNLGLLVGMTVIALGIILAFNFVAGIAQAVLEQNGGEEAGIAVALIANILGQALQTFFTVGEIQICLKLLRGQRAEVMDVFRGGPRFLPVLGVSILYGLAVGLGVLLCIVPGILLALMWWPCHFLVVEGKTGVIDSFSVASTITRGNWGNTFLLWLLSVGIMLAGFFALCIGVIFAAPLVTLLWVTAYLMMSGQLSPNAGQVPPQKW